MGNSVASIQYIANILKQKKLCLDTSPLTQGYNKGEKEWNVAKLKFTIKDNIPRNTIPSVTLLDVLLDISYKETDDTEIPVSQYNFRITVEGKNQKGLFKSSWHLDYDNNNVQDFIHPHFHITWGGNKMKDLNLGEVLLLPTPRFSYPPMDIVLGVDFILSNFVKVDIYKQIQSNSQYKAAVKKAQEKYWKPYILSLAHHWCGNNCQQIQLTNVNAKHFHPTLID